MEVSTVKEKMKSRPYFLRIWLDCRESIARLKTWKVWDFQNIKNFEIFREFESKCQRSIPDMAKVRPAGRMRPSRFFLRPLSLKYLIPYSQLYKKIWLFKPKYDFLLYPLDVWNEFAAPRTFKVTENGPWVKKSGHPWSIPRAFSVLTKNLHSSWSRFLTFWLKCL
jgi:hypothetical protein